MAAEGHWIMETVKLKKLYIIKMSISERKSGNMFYWLRSFAFVYIGSKKLQIFLKLKKISFDQERPMENLDYRQKGRKKENL